MKTITQFLFLVILGINMNLSAQTPEALNGKYYLQKYLGKSKFHEKNASVRGANDNPESYLLFTYNGNNFDTTSRAQMIYDASGNNIELTSFDYFDGTFSPTNKSEMIYDIKNRLGSELEKHYVKRFMGK